MIFYELSDAIEIETSLKKCPISESYRAMAHCKLRKIAGLTNLALNRLEAHKLEAHM